MSKRPGSSRWLQRQKKDPYVKQARQADYRSRAIYKLREIDEKDHLFYRGQTVIDLGAAPGSWSQYVASRVGPQGKVIAIDILPVEKIDNVLFIKGDFTEQAEFRQILKEHFERILTRKPKASRDNSREYYILARSFRCQMVL
jgi:23S rRNA (uridine2552-2'-O)-methyltransferase